MLSLTTIRKALNGVGKRAPKALQKAFAQRVCEPELHDWYYCLDTHGRSGEFAEMVERGAREVRKAAKRRPVFWLYDEDEEWSFVHLLFGTEKDLIAAFKVEDEFKKAGPTGKPTVVDATALYTRRRQA